MRTLIIAAGAVLLAMVGGALSQVPGYPPVGYVQVGNGAASPPSWRIQLGTMASQNANGVNITGGVVTGMPSPTNATDVANKQYVDNVASGLVVHTAVRLATAAALPANTYANGTAGVGATLTENANGALTVDGVSVATNDRITVKNEATAVNNGIYVVTQTGSGAAPYILTRAADANTVGTQNANAIGQGTFTLVTAGTANANTGWQVNTPVTTIGTSTINWAQVSAAVGVSALGGQTGSISCGFGLTCSAGSILWSGYVAPIVVPTRNVTTSTSLSNTDYFLGVGTRAAGVTVTLPGSPATGLTYLVKDTSGQAGTFNITVVPAAGTIDGANSFIMTVNYQSTALTYNGTSWSLN